MTGLNVIAYDNAVGYVFELFAPFLATSYLKGVGADGEVWNTWRYDIVVYTQLIVEKNPLMREEKYENVPQIGMFFLKWFSYWGIFIAESLEIIYEIQKCFDFLGFDSKKILTF